MQTKKSKLILLLKILFIIAAFAIIINRADTQQVARYLKQANPLYIILAYIALNAAQIISAFRVKYYFKTQNLEFNDKFSIGLYYTGMLFNNILPGGIGGDAYKIYLLGKLASFPKMTSLRLLVSDRASGLLVLMMMAFFVAYCTSLTEIIPYIAIITPFAAIATIAIYFYGIRFFLKENAQTAIGAIKYSFSVQVAGILTVLFIMVALGFDFSNFNDVWGYILLFLVSSVLAILPVSIGGVGLRELTFLYGSSFLGINPELGISIAIAYFVINLASSLNGLFFWHRLEKLFTAK